MNECWQVNHEGCCAPEDRQAREWRKTMAHIDRLYAEGRLGELETYLTEALSAADPIGLDRALLLNEQGTLLRRLGRPGAAVVALQESACLLDVYDPADRTSLNMANITTNLASAMAEAGQAEDAERYFDAALEMYRRLDMVMSRPYAAALGGAARLQSALCHADRAVEYQERAVKILEATGADAHTRAVEYGNLAMLYYRQEESEKSRQTFESALRCYEEAKAADTPGYASLLNSLGTIAFAGERYEEALEFFRQSAELLRTLFGETHPHYLSVQRYLERTISQLS